MQVTTGAWMSKQSVNTHEIIDLGVAVLKNGNHCQGGGHNGK